MLTQLVDISVIQFAFRSGILREFRLYLYLRLKHSGSAGWFTLDGDYLDSLGEEFGVSKRTIQRWIRTLKARGFLIKHKGTKRWRIQGLKKMKWRLGFKSVAATELSLPEITAPFADFRSRLLTAFLSKNFVYRKIWSKYFKPTESGQKRLLNPDYCGCGFMARNLIAQCLNISVSTAQGIVKRSEQMELISITKKLNRMKKFPDLLEFFKGKYYWPPTYYRRIKGQLISLGYGPDNDLDNPNLADRLTLIPIKDAKAVIGIRDVDMIKCHIPIKRRSSNYRRFIKKTGSLEFVFQPRSNSVKGWRGKTPPSPDKMDDNIIVVRRPRYKEYGLKGNTTTSSKFLSVLSNSNTNSNTNSSIYRDAPKKS